MNKHKKLLLLPLALFAIFLLSKSDNLVTSMSSRYLSNISFDVSNYLAGAVLSTDPNDLVFYISNQIDSKINATSPANTDLFTARPLTLGAVWPRNPNNWTAKGTAIDFTGVSAWNDYSGYQRGATLVTPRHFMAANHFKLPNGTSVTFIDSGGNPVTRKVISSHSIPGTDINIGMLDSDVDSSIATYPLINNATLKSLILKSCVEPNSLPIIVLNQRDQAILREVIFFLDQTIVHGMYTTGSRAAFSMGLAGGDSGQPGFMTVNNTPVLLFTHFSASTGPNLGNYISTINEVIDTLTRNATVSAPGSVSVGRTYSVTNLNTSGFKTYTECFSPDPGPVSLSTVTPDNVLIQNTPISIHLNGTGFSYRNNTVYIRGNRINKIVTGLPGVNNDLYFEIKSTADFTPGTYSISLENDLKMTSGTLPFVVKAISSSDTLPAGVKTHTLNTTKNGTGTGAINGSNINCGSTCSKSAINTGDTVTLNAVAESGSVFVGWSGGTCSGTGTCTFRITADTNVNAIFNLVAVVVAQPAVVVTPPAVVTQPAVVVIPPPSNTRPAVVVTPPTVVTQPAVVVIPPPSNTRPAVVVTPPAVVTQPAVVVIPPPSNTQPAVVVTPPAVVTQPAVVVIPPPSNTRPAVVVTPSAIVTPRPVLVIPQRSTPKKVQQIVLLPQPSTIEPVIKNPTITTDVARTINAANRKINNSYQVILGGIGKLFSVGK